MLRVLGYILCDLDTQDQEIIIFFLVNVSPPILFDVESLNFTCA